MPFEGSALDTTRGRAARGALSRPDRHGKAPRSRAAGLAGLGVRRARYECARIASSSRAMMLVILIAGFTAGPAVSL